jgi:hypothetical protein
LRLLLLPLRLILFRHLRLCFRRLLLRLSFLLRPLLRPLLRLCSFPVFTKVTVRTPQYPPGMQHIERHEREEHRHRVEHVREPLMLGDGAVDARGELDQAVNVAKDDEGEDKVEEVEQTAGVGGGVGGCHVDALARGQSRGFLAVDVELKADAEREEDADGEDLQPDAAHVDVEARALGGNGVCGRGHGAASALDEEGGDVTQDEDERDALGFEVEDFVIGQEEVYHAAKDHVDEGVDPEWSEEDEQLLRGGVGGGELVLDAKGAEDVTGRLPGATHDEDPGKGFLVEDRLQDVRESCEAVEADEKDGGAKRRTVVPLGVGVSDRVAFEVRHCCRCRCVGQRSNNDLKCRRKMNWRVEAKRD